MKVQCYAIFDQCSGMYEKPFFSTTDDLVRREFADVATSADHPIGKHPEHYSLWRLGMFNNVNGQLTNETNECLWTATEAISQAQQIDAAQMDAFQQQVEGSNGGAAASHEVPGSDRDDPYDLPPKQAD